ncbi:MAG TPA: DUF58 domain-containing protein [Catenuloplanes sp.]|jgi:uncharacterized protein (DUF58 family)
MRLTGRGIGLLVGAPVLFLLGYWSGFALLRVVAGGALGALLIAVLAARRRPSLRVRRELHPDQVDRGEPALGRLVVVNAGPDPVTALTARDPVAGHRDITVDLPTLAPGGSVPRTYDLPTARRGRLVLGPLRVHRGDRLGLAETTATVGGRAVLWVRPRVHPAHRMSAGRGAGHGAVAVQTPFRGSVEFRSLREYVPGDEPRHLHWKSTARTGKLMVREFMDPQRPRLAILLDSRRDVLSAAGYEDAVEVAASLAHAALAEDHALRLTSTGDTVLDTAAGATSRQVTEWLCATAQGDRTDGTDRTDRTVLLPLLAAAEGSGSCLVFITGGPSAEDLPALAAVPRRWGRLVVVDLAPDGRWAGSGLTVVEATCAADAVAGWNTVMSR